MSLSDTILQVSIFHAGELVAAQSFAERHIVVGRDPIMADLVIASGQMSREHALLEHDGERVFVHDMGSTNGVLINGQKTAWAEVRPGDAVQLGEHQLRLALQHGQTPTDDILPGVAVPATLGEMTDIDAIDVEGLDAIGEEPDTDSAMPGVAAEPAADEDFFSSINPFAAPESPAWAGRSASRRTLRPDEAAEILKAWRQAGEGAADADAEDAEKTAGWSLALRLTSTPPPPVAPGQEAAVEIIAMRGAQLAAVEWLRRGGVYRVEPAVTRRRLRRRVTGAPALSARLTRQGACVIELADKAQWKVRRGDLFLDPSVGVREGWARRRRGRMIVTLVRGDAFMFTQGPNTYHLRFTGFSKRPRHHINLRALVRQWRRPSWTATRPWLAGLIIGLALQGVVLTLLGTRPPAFVTATTPSTQTRAFTFTDIRYRDASPVPSAAWGVGAPPPLIPAPSHVTRFFPRVPGGVQGFHVAGLKTLGPSSTPAIPAPGEGVHLSRAAAFLRGEAIGIGQLLPPAGGGSAWRLQQDPRSLTPPSEHGRLESDAILKVIYANASGVEACFQKELPPDIGLAGRFSLTLTVGNNGAVKAVRKNSNMAGPLFDCVSGKVKRWRFARFKGGDVSLTYNFVLRRAGFE